MSEMPDWVLADILLCCMAILLLIPYLGVNERCAAGQQTRQVGHGHLG